MLDDLSPSTIWLSLGLILCIAEILAPGIFLLWLGIAALLTGLLALVLPVPIAAQLAAFAVLAVVSVFIGRRWTKSDAIASDDPLLNDRLARLIGQQVTVEDAIAGGRGRVRVGDSVWAATGADAPAGALVTITGSRDGVLEVAA